MQPNPEKSGKRRRAGNGATNVSGSRPVQVWSLRSKRLLTKMANYFSAPTSDWHGREAQSGKRRKGQSKSFGAAPEKHQEGARPLTLAQLSTLTKATPCPRPLNFACRLTSLPRTQLRVPFGDRIQSSTQRGWVTTAGQRFCGH